MSPARSYTTTSSLPNCCRVVVTRSRPWSCAKVTSKMPPSRSPNGFPTFAWEAAFGRPHFGHMRSVGEEYVPQWTHLQPSRSATLIGASFGSIRSPSAPASRFCSCKTSSRCFTSIRGRSGFSGLWTTRISSVTDGRCRERAWAIIDLPVPGGPTRRKCRRWFAAIRASAIASSWPTTRFNGSSGIAISAVVSKSSRAKPSSAVTIFVRAIRSTPVYGAKSLRVQTSTPAGCFVIVPIFVPTIECMFISDAMSRIRCVMMPSKTTARVCFALLSVSTSSRTGTSVTTPSPSSRRRAVEEPPSCRRMSRYFSSFGLRTFVVGVRGAGGRSSRGSRGSRGSDRNSGLGSARGCGPAAGFGSGNSDSALYTWPERPYISTYWSAGILFRRHFVEEVRPGGLRLLDHGREQGAGSLDDLVPLRHAGVLDLVDLDRGLARADAVDRFERRRQDRGLDLVQRGRDQDRAFAASFLALDVDLDSADAAALLQVPQVQFLAEEPFRLAEHGPDDVGLLDDPFRLQAGLDEIFSRTRIDVHFHTCPGEL